MRGNGRATDGTRWITPVELARAHPTRPELHGEAGGGWSAVASSPSSSKNMSMSSSLATYGFPSTVCPGASRLIRGVDPPHINQGAETIGHIVCSARCNHKGERARRQPWLQSQGDIHKGKRALLSSCGCSHRLDRADRAAPAVRGTARSA